MTDSESAISILLVDNHPVFRKAIRHILEEQADFRVVAEAGDSEEAIRLAMELEPSIVIMMHIVNAPGIIGKIKEKCPGITTLVITVQENLKHAIPMFEAGSNGYLIKSTNGDEIICAVRLIVAGKTVVNSTIFQQIFKYELRHLIKPINQNGKIKLSSREMEILDLVTRSYSNKQIAQELNLSLPTIKFYISGVYSKLNVKTRTEAVIFALQHGLINISNIE
jgi:DNA-binding NarL/FixJ family response regulator